MARKVLTKEDESELRGDFERLYVFHDPERGDRLKSDFFRTFGNENRGISIDDAYNNHYKPKIISLRNENARKKAFVDFLRNEVREGRARIDRSNQSESEYYYWKGSKFRRSGHVYPTGSMTHLADDGLMKTYDLTDAYIMDRVDGDMGINTSRMAFGGEG